MSKSKRNIEKDKNKTGIKFFIDIDRINHDYNKAKLTIMKEEKTLKLIKDVVYKDVSGEMTYKDIAKDICKQILIYKPDRIMFDLVGTGIALSEEFKELTVFESNFPNGKETFIIDDKGNITYK